MPSEFIWLLLIVLVAAVAFWLIPRMRLSPPTDKLVRIVVGAIALLAALGILFSARWPVR